MSRGRFITIEGGEGAGKSTNADLVRSVLERHGFDVLATREPGGTPLAEEIRSVLLGPRDEAVDPLAETMLIFAARAQHVAQVIEPALRAGRWVLCERFTDSTFAYQAGGRGVDAGVVAQLADLAHPGLWPDLTLYLDAPPGAAMTRIATRTLDRFERERRGFFERVRRAYAARAREQPHIVRIDASRDLASVQREIIGAVERFLSTQGDQ
ncbi:MAG: dTMP kinase [Gammaproteobacteria bacterium]|nr:dTMP kinase [Gammaproteobacteria bacterium]